MFEEIYGSGGAWALLFQQSKNYRGTRLLKDYDKLGRYLTIDQWDDLVDFGTLKINILKLMKLLISPVKI